MSQAIMGEVFNTSFGTFAVCDLSKEVRIGERIIVNGTPEIVKSIIPPTKPNGKWSIELERMNNEKAETMWDTEK